MRQPDPLQSPGLILGWQPISAWRCRPSRRPGGHCPLPSRVVLLDAGVGGSHALMGVHRGQAGVGILSVVRRGQPRTLRLRACTLSRSKRLPPAGTRGAACGEGSARLGQSRQLWLIWCPFALCMCLRTDVLAACGLGSDVVAWRPWKGTKLVKARFFSFSWFLLVSPCLQCSQFVPTDPPCACQLKSERGISDALSWRDGETAHYSVIQAQFFHAIPHASG